jgi:predicted esterase
MFKKTLIIPISIIASIIIIVLVIMIVISFLVPSKLYKPERSYNVYSPVNFSQEFIQSSGKRLDAWWIVNPNSDEVVLYFHGNSGRTLDFLSIISARYNVMSVAYPGYHYSEGKPSRDSINQAAVDTYDYVKNEMGFSDEKIIIYGHSMGGAPATYLAARKDKAKKLILVNTFSSVKSMCSLSYGPLCSLVIGYFDSAKEAKQVKIPVRQYHLKRDPVVPFSEGKKLFENFEKSKDKKFVELEFGVHSRIDINQTLR